MKRPIQGCKFLVLACASLFAMAGLADSIDIREQPLPGALREFSDQTGLQLAYVATLARNKTSPGTQGRTDPGAALSELLEGTELRHQYVNSTTVAIGSARNAAPRSRQIPGDRAPVPEPVLMANLQQLSRAADDTNENEDADARAGEDEMLELPDLRVTGSRLATGAGQRINNVIVLRPMTWRASARRLSSGCWVSCRRMSAAPRNSAAQTIPATHRVGWARGSGSADSTVRPTCRAPRRSICAGSANGPR